MKFITRLIINPGYRVTQRRDENPGGGSARKAAIFLEPVLVQEYPEPPPNAQARLGNALSSIR
jgi:hypothetical protein